MAGLSFIMYAHSRKIGRPTNSNVMRACKPEGRHRIANTITGIQ